MKINPPKEKTIKKERAKVLMTVEESFRAFFGIVQKISKVAKKQFVLPAKYNESDLNTFTASIEPPKTEERVGYTVYFEFPQKANCIAVYQHMNVQYANLSRKIVFETFAPNVGNRDKQKMVYLKMYGCHKPLFKKVGLWDDAVIFTQEKWKEIAFCPKEKTDPRANKHKLDRGFSGRKHVARFSRKW